MNQVQVYTKGIIVENLHGDPIFETATEVSATLSEVSAADFTSEFTVDEILRTMEFSSIVDWVSKQTSDEIDDIDFSEAE